MSNITLDKLNDVCKYLIRRGFVKEANLIRKIHLEVPYGKITIITRDGRLVRTEQEIIYDDCSSGLG